LFSEAIEMASALVELLERQVVQVPHGGQFPRERMFAFGEELDHSVV